MFSFFYSLCIQISNFIVNLCRDEEADRVVVFIPAEELDEMKQDQEEPAFVGAPEIRPNIVNPYNEARHLLEVNGHARLNASYDTEKASTSLSEYQQRINYIKRISPTTVPNISFYDTLKLGNRASRLLNTGRVEEAKEIFVGKLGVCKDGFEVYKEQSSSRSSSPASEELSNQASNR